MGNARKILDTLSEGKDRHTIEIVCSGDAAESLIKLLVELRKMGSQGSSRSIKIEDWDGPSSFGFDGDGAAKIDSLKLDGQEHDGKVAEAQEAATLQIGVGTSIDYNGVGHDEDSSGFEPGARGKCTIHAISSQLLQSLGFNSADCLTAQLQEKHDYSGSYAFDDEMDAVCKAIAAAPKVGESTWEMHSMGEIETEDGIEVLLPSAIFGPQ